MAEKLSVNYKIIVLHIFFTANRAGFTLREAQGTFGIFAAFSCQVQMKTKKAFAVQTQILWLCAMLKSGSEGKTVFEAEQVSCNNDK